MTSFTVGPRLVNALGVAEDAEAGALGADAEARPANFESAIAEMGASPAGTGKGGDGRERLEAAKARGRQSSSPTQGWEGGRGHVGAETADGKDKRVYSNIRGTTDLGLEMKVYNEPRFRSEVKGHRATETRPRRARTQTNPKNQTNSGPAYRPKALGQQRPGRTARAHACAQVRDLAWPFLSLACVTLAPWPAPCHLRPFCCVCIGRSQD